MREAGTAKLDVAVGEEGDESGEAAGGKDGDDLLDGDGEGMGEFARSVGVGIRVCKYRCKGTSNAAERDDKCLCNAAEASLTKRCRLSSNIHE